MIYRPDFTPYLPPEPVLRVLCVLDNLDVVVRAVWSMVVQLSRDDNGIVTQ